MNRPMRRPLTERERVEERLAQCETALAEGIKFKVSGGDFLPAIGVFEDAYRLATEEPRLPRPWPQIAAYRLAHILMRAARTYDELARVEELLQEAGRLTVDVLGPVPSIYRLAVLHRMTHAAPDAAQVEGSQAALTRLFASLVGGAQAQPWDVGGSSRAAAVQGTLHNYLELASYFTGEPYGALQGLSSPIGDLLLEDEWRVLGSHGVGRHRHVRLPYGLARAELEARAEKGEADLCFELGDITVRESGLVWCPGAEPMRIPLRSMLLFVKYCRSPQASSVELERAVIPAGEEGGTQLKNIVARLRDGLDRCAEINGRPVIQKGTRSVPPRLNPEIRVVGMVHANMLDADPPPLGRYERESYL